MSYDLSTVLGCVNQEALLTKLEWYGAFPLV